MNSTPETFRHDCIGTSTIKVETSTMAIKPKDEADTLSKQCCGMKKETKEDMARKERAQRQIVEHEMRMRNGNGALNLMRMKTLKG